MPWVQIKIAIATTVLHTGVYRLTMQGVTELLCVKVALLR